MDASQWASSAVSFNITHYDTTPCNGLLQLLEKEKYTDITFIVENHRVPAHRCVVASQSDYFDCLLFGSMKEARSDEITLEDTPLEAFRLLITYMYSGTVKTVDMEIAVELLDLADRYGFESLAQSIEKRLCSVINPTNVLQLLFHSEIYNAPLLNQTCLNFVDTNAELILSSKDVLTLQSEHLKYLISRDTFFVDEIQIFWAVLRWKEHNSVSTDNMTDILQCVRLTEIPHEDLRHVILPSCLYSNESVDKAIATQLIHSPAIVTTRGKQTMGQNLFEDTCARLESVQNYTVYILSTAQNATIVNLIFKSIVTPSMEETSITVEFDEIYLINELKLEGLQAQGVAVQPGKTGAPFSYVIDVCKDEFFQWTRIVDYSNLSCYSTQQLYFPKQAVKYVRFTQTKGHEAFTLRFASCSYASSVAFQYRDGGIMSPISPFTPIYSQHLAPLTSDCYVRCFVTFNQPYSVSMIRFRMKEVTVLPETGEIQVYLATQSKARHYQMVTDLKDHRYDSELHVTFPERVVSIISITIPLTLKITNRDNALIQSGEQLERLLESVHFTVEDLFCQALQVP